MKKIIFCAMLLGFNTCLFSQEATPKQTLNNKDYQVKSKNQKTAAWVLLGGGVVLIGTGFLVGNRNESSFSEAATGAIIGGIGVLSAIGSIPLFIASGRNKRKAMNVSAYFEIHQNGAASQKGLIYRSSPALAMKINF